MTIGPSVLFIWRPTVSFGMGALFKENRLRMIGWKKLPEGCLKLYVYSGIVKIIGQAHSLEDPKCALFTNVVHTAFGHKEVLQ